MKSNLVRLLLVMAIVAIAQPVHALDFDKEIAKNEVSTVTLVDSLDKSKTYVASGTHAQKGDVAVQLIPKKRMIARSN